jgi:actin-like ATPase involved in cell morphogenesis
LGHTNCRVSWLNGDGPQILANGDNERFTPSLLAIHTDGQVLSGRSAAGWAALHPERAVPDVVAKLGAGEHVTVNGFSADAGALVEQLIRRLRTDAEKRMGEDVSSAFVAVPPDWTAEARLRFSQAGQRAGLPVVLIESAMAAALAAGCRQPAEGLRRVLVFDLGGALCSVTLLAWQADGLATQQTASMPGVAGLAFDQQIVDYVSVLIEQQHHVKPASNPRFMADLRRQAEHAKIALGGHRYADVVIMGGMRTPSGAPIDVEVELSREDFERMVEDKIAATTSLARHVLGRAGLSPEQVDSVVLVGGSTCVPSVRAGVEAVFGSARIVRGVDPLEGVAMGIAWMTGNLSVSVHPFEAMAMPAASASSASWVGTEDDVPTNPPAEPQPQPVSEMPPEPPAEPQPQPVSQPLAEAPAEPQPQPVSEMPPEPPAEPQPQSVSQAPVEAPTDPQPQPVSEEQPDAPAEPQPQPVSERPPESPAEAQPQPVSQAPAETPAEPQPQPVSERPPEPPTEPQPQPVTQAPVEVPTEPQPVSEEKPEALAAPQPQPVGQVPAEMPAEPRPASGSQEPPALEPPEIEGLQLVWEDVQEVRTRHRFAAQAFVRIGTASVWQLATPAEVDGPCLCCSFFYLDAPVPPSLDFVLILKKATQDEIRAVLSAPLSPQLAAGDRIDISLEVDYETGHPFLTLSWREPEQSEPVTRVCRNWTPWQEPVSAPLPPEDEAAVTEVESVAVSEVGATAEPPEPPAEPKERCGPYELLESVEQGRYSETFVGADQASGERVLITVFSPNDERAKSAFSGSLLPLSIHHPNVVEVRHFGWTERGYYVATEQFGTKTLRSLLGSGMERQPAAVGEVLVLIAQVCEGLQALHDHHVFHRNMKPANVLIDAGGTVAKIADFQVAVSLRGRDRVTQVSGTLPYMAKEVLEGSADHRADIYAVGVMLYELLTGKLPFWSTSQRTLVDQITNQAPPEPRSLNPRIPEYLNDAILRALEKDTQRRFQTANELRDGLTQQPDSWYQTITSGAPQL